MNKYTHEQRKIIAEYLESEILPLSSLLNQHDRIKERWVNECDIKDKIKELSTITFGDIKNREGIKFKAQGVMKNRIFMTCRHLSNVNDFFILNTSSGVIIPLSHISDHESVELINE